ncbi:uncharacterized protein LOC123014563 isoform X2 [Tribolium madens]|uniref:uncharacterized protein LOC123014563 isoform X2 n=1 Tax=Tribolium madens TaxID=41895 RepID=UPI001CF72817|nr:uncharacterized protein LOC123014563 isoform X2 [Tribolium madens]
MPLKLHKRKFLFELLLVASISLLCFTPLFFYKRRTTTLSLTHIEAIQASIPTLVSTNKCLIPDLSQLYFQEYTLWFPDTYKPCTRRNVLTYMTGATLHIKQRNGFYPNVSCCYSNITRNTDDDIDVSGCAKFRKNVTLEGDFVRVECDTTPEPYQQVHAVIKKPEKKWEKWPKPFSVLILGIDKISRLSFVRNFPKTHHFMTSNNHWLPLNGYTKISDETAPNILALLTGLKSCEKCNFIWSDFEKCNYTTVFAEDDIWTNSFTFGEPPTNYYFRPYFMASERFPTVEINKFAPCPDPEAPFERLVNLVKDFTVMFKNEPSFGFFWIKSATPGTLPKLDYTLRGLFRFMNRKGVFKDTFVFFLSDQGKRERKIEFTNLAWLEEKLPFSYLAVPLEFKEVFPEEYDSLKLQQDSLTTPFDLYMTLQEILLLAQLKNESKPSGGCPKCESLFMDVKERSCQDSGVEEGFCPCGGYLMTDRDDLIVKNASNFIVSRINVIIDRKKCRSFELRKVLSASLSRSSGHRKFLISVETYPFSVFESFVSYFNGSFAVDGAIRRLDFAIVRCVSDSFMKKFCFCREE